MIKEVTGYKWVNKNGANSAEQIAKQFYGFPKQPNYVTTECFTAEHNTGSEGDFWYHIGELEPLGNVTTFTININEEV